ncbi:YjbR protein [Micromonospora mirobrigensis]|uniref:YjbR protein n=1 Tax=Micromonospora mirobrigensis TaxID=262898 RepID=A0A1C4WA09_9ACTN|nr:YjbR protein [Micromonospora mirobrigensis]
MTIAGTRTGGVTGNFLSEGAGSFADVTGPQDVPPEILDRLRPVCLGLPETHEEPAWIGTRWRIRQRTFAHVYTVDPDHPAAHAQAADGDEPVCVLTFRSSGDELAALVGGGHPFFKPDWGADVIGMLLDDGVDWAEVGELLTESYCLRAPKKLAARVDRPAELGASSDGPLG